MIKLKVSYFNSEDKKRLIDTLSKEFKVIKVSKAHEGSKDSQKRIYVDLDSTSIKK